MSTYSRLSSYTGRQNLQRGFEEVNLPFDSVSKDRDYISGEELYDALTSRELRDSLEGYRISSSRSLDGRFEFKASRGSYIGLGKPSYMAFEGEIETFEDDEFVEAKHYHMRLEVAAPDEEAMELVEQDLGLLEEGLRNYYADETEETRPKAKVSSIAD